MPNNSLMLNKRWNPNRAVGIRGIRNIRSQYGSAQRRIEEVTETNKYLLRQMQTVKRERGDTFLKGQRIMLIDLNTESFNGRYATVELWDEVRERYRINMDDDKRTIYVHEFNMVTRYYGISIRYDIIHPKQIMSLDDIFKAWRDVSMWQLNKWCDVSKLGSDGSRPFQRHIQKCLHNKKFDPTGMDDFDIIDTFAEWKEMFVCKRPSCNFLRVLTKWQMIQQMAQVWHEFTKILFAGRRRDLKINWYQKAERCIKDWGEFCNKLEGPTAAQLVTCVEIRKGGKQEDMYFPPYRLLRERALKILEVCVRIEDQSPYQVFELNPRWKPVASELGLKGFEDEKCIYREDYRDYGESEDRRFRRRQNFDRSHEERMRDRDRDRDYHSKRERRAREINPFQVGQKVLVDYTDGQMYNGVVVGNADPKVCCVKFEVDYEYPDENIDIDKLKARDEMRHR